MDCQTILIRGTWHWHLKESFDHICPFTPITETAVSYISCNSGVSNGFHNGLWPFRYYVIECRHNHCTLNSWVCVPENTSHPYPGIQILYYSKFLIICIQQAHSLYCLSVTANKLMVSIKKFVLQCPLTIPIAQFLLGLKYTLHILLIVQQVILYHFDQLICHRSQGFLK